MTIHTAPADLVTPTTGVRSLAHGSTESPAWQAFMLASLMRDSVSHHGGELAGSLVLPEEKSEVLMIGLHRLAELTRQIASAKG